ncbi:MAG: bifunctional [glutamine synthetase] adenylyltransferase/[glutamine synthetase]-adenylyl-L-tyrosine phosphorylase, partial [Naasia sp.]
MRRELATLSVLARLGFTELGRVVAGLDRLEELTGIEPTVLLDRFGATADPDAALGNLLQLAERHPDLLRPTLASDGAAARLLLVLGASSGLADFLLRHPEELSALASPAIGRPDVDELCESLLDAVGAVDGVASLVGDEGRVALRVRYRHHLLRLAAWDLGQPKPLAALRSVTEILADLAGAALEASLAIARADATRRGSGPGVFPAAEVAQVDLAVIGMGKAGARELNYVSDVDVIFVGQAADGAEIGDERALNIATRLAMLTMRGINEIAVEPPLWEVDANLRPEGKAGVLVRTLESHLTYYDRWAKDWEFQALLKARPLAGDLALGEAYVTGTQAKVWSSASRESFVEQVQRMRGRVTDNIPADEVDRQLKLGPGGLRDIEFTVQLLQLVHGQLDETVREKATLPALQALAAAGYIGRAEAEEFSEDYRLLRVLEHRLQLSRLSRTHLMPSDAESQRILARASGIGTSAEELLTRWRRTKSAVRNLHERLFYRPLLSVVARAPEQGLSLTSAQAEARLAAIGFRDARGALAHIAALTAGVSRKAAIQRTLLPVLLQWFADGADPDGGLLAFR